ncbi:MAG: tetratricopeptide repeat protein [Vicinamibacterales bacterium]
MRQAPAVTAAALVAVILAVGVRVPAQQQGGPSAAGEPVRLSPTNHPPVPPTLAQLWHVPARTAAPASLADLVKGARLLDDEGNAAAAVPLLTRAAAQQGGLSDYARFYLGRAYMALGRTAEAEAAFAAVASSRADGHLPEDAAFGQAEARAASGNFAGAATVYRALLERKLAAPHVAVSRLATAAEESGDVDSAIDAYRRVYYEFPLSTESAEAEKALTRLNAWSEDGVDVSLELARADALFAGRRWAAARASYERARDEASGAERDRAALRMAACDVQSGRYRDAREPLKGQLAGPYRDEASFFYITALRGLGDTEEYTRQARIFADGARESPFAQEILNNLATHFIIADEDARADEVFRLVLDRYPAGPFAERAYWRSGWWAYRDGRFAEAARLFDRGAAQFPRSDYRPSWLYWSGRAWQRAGNAGLGDERLLLAATDYYNSYYGRLARTRLGDRVAGRLRAQVTRGPIEPSTFPTASRVADLIAAGLFHKRSTRCSARNACGAPRRN